MNPFHRWAPIGGPGPASLGYDFHRADSLHDMWLRDRENRPGQHARALGQIARSWAVETGVIEGIYRIDPELTRELTAWEGLFSPNELDPERTDTDPRELAVILNDHLEGLEYARDHARRGRELSSFLVRDLHIILTRSRPTHTAIDRFGTVFQARMEPGRFKTRPNNPTRRDGRIHEYCPPLQVESELDNLARLYRESEPEFHPLVVGAWLHHRFAQIHPFPDGNGRVARALLAWHLERSDWPQVAVRRSGREQYIDCLEYADGGMLWPLTNFLMGLAEQSVALAMPGP